MLPGSGKDSEAYFLNSVRYAQEHIVKKGKSFNLVMGKFFSFTGISRLLGQFLIVLCSVAAIHIAVLILEKMGVNLKIRRKTMYLLCLLPNFAILSGIFVRETMIIMCMAISLYYFVKWFYDKSELFFALAFVFVFCGAAFHAGVVGVAVGYIVVRVIYDDENQTMKFSIKGIAFAIMFLLIFVFLYNNYSDTLFGKVSGVEDISDIARDNVAGGSDYSAYVGNSDNPINLILYTPIRIVYFLFSPFPWQWRDLNDIIAFCFSSMFYMWTLIKSIQYLRSGADKNRQIVMALLVLTMCTAFVFAWGVSNTGTAIRHRDKMVVLYAMLYSLTSKNGETELSAREN